MGGRALEVVIGGSLVKATVHGLHFSSQLAALHRIAAEVYAEGPLASDAYAFPCVCVDGGWVKWETNGTKDELREARIRLNAAAAKAGVR